mgnify:CR=1 FL=1
MTLNEQPWMTKAIYQLRQPEPRWYFHFSADFIFAIYDETRTGKHMPHGPFRTRKKAVEALMHYVTGL